MEFVIDTDGEEVKDGVRVNVAVADGERDAESVCEVLAVCVRLSVGVCDPVRVSDCDAPTLIVCVGLSNCEAVRDVDGLRVPLRDSDWDFV